MITTGNHVYKHREIYPYLDENPRIVRPFNLLPANPGRGLTVVDTPAGRLGVLNLMGSLFLNAARSAFEVVDDALDQLHGVRNIVVDLHAEATSEKVAMGRHLDGRVTPSSAPTPMSAQPTRASFPKAPPTSPTRVCAAPATL